MSLCAQLSAIRSNRFGLCEPFRGVRVRRRSPQVASAPLHKCSIPPGRREIQGLSRMPASHHHHRAARNGEGRQAAAALQSSAAAGRSWSVGPEGGLPGEPRAVSCGAVLSSRASGTGSHQFARPNRATIAGQRAGSGSTMASTRMPAPSPVARILRSVCGAGGHGEEAEHQDRGGAGDQPAGAAEAFGRRPSSSSRCGRSSSRMRARMKTS